MKENQFSVVLSRMIPELGCTQNDVAHKSNLSVSKVSRLATGRVRCDKRALVRLLPLFRADQRKSLVRALANDLFPRETIPWLANRVPSELVFGGLSPRGQAALRFLLKRDAEAVAIEGIITDLAIALGAKL